MLLSSFSSCAVLASHLKLILLLPLQRKDSNDSALRQCIHFSSPSTVAFVFGKRYYIYIQFTLVGHFSNNLRFLFIPLQRSSMKQAAKWILARRSCWMRRAHREAAFIIYSMYIERVAHNTRSLYRVALCEKFADSVQTSRPITYWICRARY